MAEPPAEIFHLEWNRKFNINQTKYKRLKRENKNNDLLIKIDLPCKAC